MRFSGSEHVPHDDDGTRERRSNVSRRKAAYDWLDWHGRNGSDVRERVFEGRLEEVHLAHDLLIDNTLIHSLVPWRSLSEYLALATLSSSIELL